MNELMNEWNNSSDVNIIQVSVIFLQYEVFIYELR